MCVIGFVNSEGITLIGGATFIAALIDLGFFLYIDYCDITPKVIWKNLIKPQS